MIPITKRRGFAKIIAEEFLREKTNADLKIIEQDNIDTFVIPIMSEVEDMINDFIGQKIQEAFTDAPLKAEEDWW